MIRAIALFLLALAVQAQSPRLVFQTFTVSGAGPITLGPVRNIGQAGHVLEVLWRNNGINTCPANAAANIGFQVGFDATNFTTRGALILNNAPNDYTITSFQGAFPYVQIVITSYDNVNCTIFPTYSGFASPVDPFITNKGTLRSTGALAPASIGNNTLITGIASRNIVVYEMIVWNGTGTNTITIQDSGGTAIQLLRAFPANTGYVASLTGRPHITVASGLNLVANLTAATAVDFAILYQIE